jgi:hypothetical protein
LPVIKSQQQFLQENMKNFKQTIVSTDKDFMIGIQDFLTKEKPKIVKKRLEGMLLKYKLLQNLTI